MASMDLKTAVSRNGAKAEIALAGRLDVRTAQGFRHAFSACLRDDGAVEVVVNLADLEYIDSYGIGMLLGYHKEAAEHRKALAVENCRPTVKKLLWLLNLHKALDIR